MPDGPCCALRRDLFLPQRTASTPRTVQRRTIDGSSTIDGSGQQQFLVFWRKRARQRAAAQRPWQAGQGSNVRAASGSAHACSQRQKQGSGPAGVVKQHPNSAPLSRLDSHQQNSCWRERSSSQRPTHQHLRLSPAPSVWESNCYWHRSWWRERLALPRSITASAAGLWEKQGAAHSGLTSI